MMAEPMDGVSFEDVLTGFGVIVAAEAALGSLEGRSVAIEGFGKVGGGVAREAARRGARVVAISTLAGSVAKPSGFDPEELWSSRAEHGDELVHHLGATLRPPSGLFEVEAAVLVPGARTGVIDLERARTIPVRAIAPAANVPYVGGATEILRERGVVALPDFICNAGAVLGYVSTSATTHREVLDIVERSIRELTLAAMKHPQGPFAGGCSLAEDFLRTWRGPSGLPPGPPLAAGAT